MTQAVDGGWWHSNRFWIQADYLMRWVKPGPNPVALLTTGADTDDTPGAIGQPGTKILFGDAPVGFGLISGMQLTVGYWIRPDQSMGLELSAFVLSQVNQGPEANSDANGNPFLLRPFFNTQTNAEDVATVTFPGLLTGRIVFRDTTQLWGSEINLLCNWVKGSSGRIDAIYGFRYLQLNEELRIDENFAPLEVEDNTINFAGQAFGFPDSVRVLDQFKVKNQFYGAQFGARAELNFGRLQLDARAKVALGTTHSHLDTDGASFLLDGSGNLLASSTGGLLALKSNIGSRTTDSFTVVPSIELRVSCFVRDNIRIHVGYDFLYMSNLIRPGDQIDRNIDPRQVPTFQDFDPTVNASQPKVFLKHTDFWAQGLDFGLEIRF